MWKAGLIVAGVMLVLSIGGTLLLPPCVPCLALFVGFGAGYLAGVFERNPEGAIGGGAIAGAVGGGGAVIGHLIGAVINVNMVGPEKAAQIMQQLGIEGSADPAFYYLGAYGGNLCFGLVEVVLMAGLGALGGLLWRQTQKSSQ